MTASHRRQIAAEQQLRGDSIDAYSIAEFCRRHSISVPLFYKLKQQGKAPETFSCGDRRLVSREAARAWRQPQVEKEKPIWTVYDFESFEFDVESKRRADELCAQLERLIPARHFYVQRRFRV